MIHSQNEKVVSLLKPQSVATNGTATGTVDTRNFRYAKVVLQLDTASSSNTDVVVQVKEGDTTSSFATHADLAMTTVAPQTSTPDFFVWFLDLKKRKRFLQILYTPSASAARLAAAHCNLSRAEQPPTTAAGRGATGQVVA